MMARWRLHRARSLVWKALQDKEHLPATCRAPLKEAHFALTKAIEDSKP